MLEKIIRKSGFPPYTADTFTYLSLENEVLKFSLTNPTNKKKIFVNGVFNQKFGGEILVSEDLYLKLELEKCELPTKLWSVGKFNGEKVVLNCAYAIFEVDGFKKIVVVEIFKRNRKNLIGRGLIRALISTTMGPLG